MGHQDSYLVHRVITLLRVLAVVRAEPISSARRLREYLLHAPPRDRMIYQAFQCNRHPKPLQSHNRQHRPNQLMPGHKPSDRVLRCEYSSALRNFSLQRLHHGYVLERQRSTSRERLMHRAPNR